MMVMECLPNGNLLEHLLELNEWYVHVRVGFCVSVRVCAVSVCLNHVMCTCKCICLPSQWVCVPVSLHHVCTCMCLYLLPSQWVCA